MGLIVGRPQIDSKEEVEKLLKAVGDISDIRVFGTKVLVALYMPEKVGSLVATANTQRENRYQGKVGLVLKKGHLAFVSDDSNNFGPDTVEVGDWVYFDYAVGSELEIHREGTFEKVVCKVMRDTEINGVAPRPDAIY